METTVVIKANANNLVWEAPIAVTAIHIHNDVHMQIGGPYGLV